MAVVKTERGNESTKGNGWSQRSSLVFRLPLAIRALGAVFSRDLENRQIRLVIQASLWNRRTLDIPERLMEFIVPLLIDRVRRR